MLTESAVQFFIELLEYVLPVAFLWAMVDRVVRAVIKAATGRSREGI